MLGIVRLLLPRAWILFLFVYCTYEVKRGFVRELSAIHRVKQSCRAVFNLIKEPRDSNAIATMRAVCAWTVEVVGDEGLRGGGEWVKGVWTNQP